MYDIDREPTLELYDLDLTPVGGNIERFHPYSTIDSLTYNGNTYNPISIQAEGFELTSKGLPSPKITIGNALGTITQLILQYDGLQGAKLTRTKLQGHVNPPHQYSSTDIIGSAEIYIIDRPTNETRISVTFELKSIFDLSSLKLPRRTIFNSVCSWVYKSPECGYIGSFTTCDRNLTACRQHFQQMTGESNPVINYGGFTGVDKYPN